MNPYRKPELLCPAGSPAALRAAIEGGADAVYLGGVAFNARINAKNFTPEELSEGIALAHAYGVKVYVAANTLIFDREREEHLRAAEDAYLRGADGLIVADLGAADAIRQRIDIPLHASTQLSGHNVAVARFLQERGFSRMVCAREMSREDLRTFCADSPIEAEVFVHGALCVCHSGQCLFSSLVGGRSGNRGECAQPCRLPFRRGRGESYPLSLKDLSLARYVDELCDMGVSSFKIEGRMKSPEYVRDVARIWRRLIDEHRGADDREMEELAAVFSRGGHTDGYYVGRINGSMLGIRSAEDKESSRSLEPFRGLSRRIPISLRVTLLADSPMLLSLQCGERSVTVAGEIPQAARTAPLDREAVLRCFTRLGNTPYEAISAEVELGKGLMVPVSAMNALRRRGIDALMESASVPRSAEDFSPAVLQRPSKRADADAKGRSALFYRPERMPAAAVDFFEQRYAPIDRYFDSPHTNGVLLPSVIYDSELPRVRALLQKATEAGAKYLLVGNPGHLALARESGLELHGDFRLNVTNGGSAALWEQEGLSDVILSPELTLPRIRDLGGASRVTVYGRLPLMVTEKCVGKELGDCRRCTEGELFLTDRRGIRFPVLREWEHRSLIVNSVPVYMADKQKDLAVARVSLTHFIFTVESQQEIASVISAYRSAQPPRSEIRRI